MRTALFLIWAGAAQILIAAPPPVRTVYFVPADCDIIPGHVERLDRVMTEVQRFYRAGMEANGYGPLTLALDRDGKGVLRVPVVRGQFPRHTYGRNSDQAVRSEVKSALARQGIDLDLETVVIFQVLLAWQDQRAIEVGPYVGAGDHRTGTAWVYDDERLDPRMLESKVPGGYYGQPCSLGEFNSHYIGGVAHELGHAFGLPHVAGPASEKRHSLMGDGNHTYGQELRGEGPGSYLHPASALRLSRHSRFIKPAANPQTPPECSLVELQANFQNQKLILQGQLKAQPAVLGIAAYNDNASVPSDYDAVGWTAPVDTNGNFRVEIGEVKPGQFELRLESVHENGAVSTSSYDYRVDSSGQPDLRVFPTAFLQMQALALFRGGDRMALQQLVDPANLNPGVTDDFRRQVKHLLLLLDPPKPVDLAHLPTTQKNVEVSGLEFESAATGWGPPLRDQVLMENQGPCLIQVGGSFYQKGLYAHAPARYTLKLDGHWTQFTSQYGLQDGHSGSVVFVVRGDGKELFRSQQITDHGLGSLAVKVASIKQLELLVEDGNDGPASDWGVWVNPRLER